MGCAEKPDITELFGSNVFNDKVMKEKLPKNTYKALKEVVAGKTELTLDVANVVAHAIKEWALAKGASHYTHWFQPLTNITAEKHDSFIDPAGDGSVIMEFSGKQLIKGEPDASSFPSGGLRATFEARGYTAWDCTSPVFLKTDAVGDVTLCIPTAFCSYTGHALDKKTPLLRSMNAVSKQAIRVLKVFGNTTASSVVSTVGPEQEYFLIDQEYYAKRLDLIMSGRTLFGAPSAKGQELEDQYFGSIKDRVAAFMKDLDIELWKMGVLAKTKHNEVAPCQFEIAPVFSTTNISADHNQLLMETAQKIALRHDMVCLLHEKPYAGINGSGKHNNWSLSTNDGVNLLNPGKTPEQNEQFLAFCAAVIKAVDTHADLLRASCATSGNDHRLGANEAPPGIISIFLGDTLDQVLHKIAKGEKFKSGGKEFLKLGADTLPALPLDNSDRNRTSPFAFTGDKFEFRMVGSAQSISGPNVTLNTITAEALDELATRLEKAKDLNSAVADYVKEVIEKHGKVIFNGNGYTDAWPKEAEKRGLPNVKNTVDALKAWLTPKAQKLYEKYGVLTKEELHSRYEIYVEQYVKHVNIEARCAIKMSRTLYIPAALTYAGKLAKQIKNLKKAEGSTKIQDGLLTKVSAYLEAISKKTDKLEAAIAKAKVVADATDQAVISRDVVFPAIASLREDVDALEIISPADIWPVPTYADMLFNL
ncbi:glutamine synthetase type III [Candidatus Termititenax spirochaetophilus]|uniref:Glutamine synthetase type III n=1 Tax=Candidatus Termititenax spirochaetophilus TaxID=2218522 RepID=A0A388T7I6_9BACT|nr:glutamine synthetase type III [Candidatus Termititenax spirochaetophilus]